MGTFTGNKDTKIEFDWELEQMGGWSSGNKKTKTLSLNL